MSYIEADPMFANPAPAVATLDELLAEIHKAFAGDNVCVEYVKELLFNYKSNIKEWKKFAKFDRYKYTRNLIDFGNENFNVMLLCWGPSHQSTIHDHANAHCFMKQLDGSLEEVRFGWPEEGSDEPLKETSHADLKQNEIVYINDSMGLHRVQNPSNVEEAVSLHIYSPPFDACQVFDEMTGKKKKCHMTFWSRNGVKVNYKHVITLPAAVHANEKDRSLASVSAECLCTYTGVDIENLTFSSLLILLGLARSWPWGLRWLDTSQKKD